MSNYKLTLNDAINLALIILGLPFLLLSIYNHPQNDDYVFAVASKNFGVVEANLSWYMSWTGRYFSTALLSLNPLVFDSFMSFKIVTAVIITALAGSIYYFINKLFSKSLTVKEKITAALVFFILYLFKMPNLVEGLYWMAGSVTYQVGNILFLLICGILFGIYGRNEAVPTAKTGILLATLIFAASGTNEVTMVLLLEISMLTLAYSIIKGRHRLLASMLTVSSCISGAIVMLAPGTTTRFDSVPHHEFVSALLNSLRAGIASMAEWLFATPLLPITVVFYPFLVQRLVGRTFTDVPKPLILFASLGMYFSLFVPSFYGTGLIETRTINVIYAFFLVAYFTIVILFADKAGALFQKFQIYRPSPYKYVLIGWIAVTVVVPASNLKIVVEDLVTGKARGYDKELKQRYSIIRECDRIICAVPSLQHTPKSIFFFENAVDNQNDEQFYKNYKMKYASYFRRLKIELQ